MILVNFISVNARSYFFFLLICAGISQLSAQDRYQDSARILKTTIFEGDTIPLFELKEVQVWVPPTFENKRQERRYGRLQRYVVKVYPYAKIAGEMLQDFDDTLRTFTSDRKRKKYLKGVEEQLKVEFGGELKQLTIKQGIILVKLIDRETGNTSYDLIKQLRGSFSAFIWQSLARLFGSNLKLEYDPYGEDYLIEDIVRKLENGQLSYKKRERKTGI
jgi:hypothetical protein